MVLGVRRHEFRRVVIRWSLLVAMILRGCGFGIEVMSRYMRSNSELNLINSNKGDTFG